MRIGAHESIAGGLHTAFDRALEDGAEALQIFTKSGRQWACREITDEDARLFRRARAETGLPVVAHASYLMNLAAPAGEIREKSLAAFREELERCETLGIPWLVLHPGAHPDEDEGLRLVVQAVRGALKATRGMSVGVCLEITAGQGNCLGHRFEHLARLLDGIDAPERTGVCLDTCHLFAAGYDIASADGYEETIRDFERIVGLERVKAMHLNDAQKGLGCRVDRHARIGRGTLGRAVFERLLRDRRFAGLPAVLETPDGLWREEIALLKRLRAATAAKRPASNVSKARTRKVAAAPARLSTPQKHRRAPRGRPARST